MPLVALFTLVNLLAQLHGSGLAGCPKGRVDKNRFNGFADAGKTAEAVEFPSCDLPPG
jgi:hypothetical protein